MQESYQAVKQRQEKLTVTSALVSCGQSSKFRQQTLSEDRPTPKAALPPPQLEPQSIEAITRRVAKAMAHPLRVRILAAVNLEDMGPGRFTRRNPDVDLREASRHFRRLADLECIELIGRREGRGREHLYRAVRRAIFDASSWGAVPPEYRAGVTGEAMATYMDRVAEAAEAGTLDVRDGRHVTWTALTFDEIAWARFIEAIDEAFYDSLELRVEASLRIAKTGEAPIPATVGLFCFQSPREEPIGQFRQEEAREATALESTFLSLRSAKALATPLRVRILVELNKRPMSPVAFHKRFAGGSLQHVAVEFRRLEELRCIELVESKREQGRKGANESVYRAVQRSLFDEETWKALPPSLRSDVTSITFTTFIEQVAEAARAGLLDAREDRHFTWTAMHFDLQAWNEMLSALHALLRLSLRLDKESEARLASDPTQAVPVTVGLSCFESPPQAAVTPTSVIRSLMRP